MQLLPIERRNSRWWHLLNATTRLAILRGATRPFADNVVVNEYPKSGGSWLSQMLAEDLDIPYPRNRLPMIGTCLMQCHVLNPMGMKNVVIIWRDGRDIAVSFYHHLLIGHEFKASHQSKDTAKRLGISDPRDIMENMPKFLEAMMTAKVGTSFTWPQFVNTWNKRKDVVETRYEDLLADTKGELERLTNRLSKHNVDQTKISRIVDKYSFTAQSGRKHGEERKGSFLRKGISGDWKNCFSIESIQIFDHYAGETLRNLGYGN